MTHDEAVRRKVIKGLEETETASKQAIDNGGEMSVIQAYMCGCRVREALILLKKQEVKIEHLKRPDCEHAEHDGTGCLGYCGCTQDDEPIEACKRCEKYTGNISDGW